MPILLTCPQCGSRVSAPDETAGRKVRCGGCMAIVAVPEPLAAEPVIPFAEAAEPAEFVEPPVRSSRPSRPPRAEPVAPRRRRRPQPTNSGARIVLWVVGGLFALLLLGGGLVALVVWRTSEPKWQTHEPPGGGFRVELPSAPRDMRGMAGLGNDPDLHIFGTVIPFRNEEYGVIWGDIHPWKQGLPADQLMNEGVAALEGNDPPARKLSERSLEVSGFPAREVVCKIGPETGTYWIVIAETRMFIVFVGGPGRGADDARAKRFLDSFEIIDPNLLAKRDQRRRQKEVIEERARQAESERQAMLERQAAAERVRVQNNVASAGGTAAVQVEGEATSEQEAVLAEIRRLEAATRDSGSLAAGLSLRTAETEREGIRRMLAGVSDSGQVAAALTLQTAEAERAEFFRALAIVSDGGRVSVGVVLATAERDVRQQRLAEFTTTPYAGGPVIDPAEIPGLVFHLGFDDRFEHGIIVGPKWIAGNRYPNRAMLGAGVRGTALYLPAQTPLDLSKLPALEVRDDASITVSVWFKTRGQSAELVQLGNSQPAMSRMTGLGFNPVLMKAYAMESPNANGPAGAALRKRVERPWVPDNKWHHVALVMTTTVAPQRSHRVELYFNGVQVGKTEWPGGDLTTTKLLPKVIGAALGELPGMRPDDPILGIDEVCVFDRPLRDNEISRLAGRPIPPLAPAPRLGTNVTLALAGHVRPNSVAAFDPGRNTVWVVEDTQVTRPEFAVRPANPETALLYRYSLPDLKLVGKYEIPAWGYRAAFDPANNQLYLAVAGPKTRNSGTSIQYPRGIGEIHSFNLNGLEPNDGKEPPQLAPASVWETHARVFSMAVAPDGKTVYASVERDVGFGLFRLPANLSRAEPLQLPNTQGGGKMAVTPDGKTLLVVAPYSNVLARHEVDTATWTVRKTTTYGSGATLDWAVGSGTRVFASSPSGTKHGVRFAEDPEPGRTPPKRVFNQAQDYPTQFSEGYFLAATPDGKHLFCSGEKVPGLWVISADRPIDRANPGRLPLAAGLFGDEHVKLTGPITLSPDGRWVLYRDGRVVRVDYSTPEPAPAGK